MAGPEGYPGEYERLLDVEKDTELTARLLGALGLVDATLYNHPNPEHIDSQWPQYIVPTDPMDDLQCEGCQ